MHNQQTPRKPFESSHVRRSTEANNQHQHFRDQLTLICDFLTENKSKTNYILDLFFQRHVC